MTTATTTSEKMREMCNCMRCQPQGKMNKEISPAEGKVVNAHREKCCTRNL